MLLLPTRLLAAVTVPDRLASEPTTVNAPLPPLKFGELTMSAPPVKPNTPPLPTLSPAAAPTRLLVLETVPTAIAEGLITVSAPALLLQLGDFTSHCVLP